MSKRPLHPLPVLVGAVLLLASLAAVAYVGSRLEGPARHGGQSLWLWIVPSVLGFGLLGWLPVGRPGSLRAGERAPTLAFAFLLGVPATVAINAAVSFAGLRLGQREMAVSYVALGVGLLLLRRALGPAAMIPGRAPAVDASWTGRVATWGGFALAATLTPWNADDAAFVLAAVVLAAEALRLAGVRGERRWWFALCAASPTLLDSALTTVGLLGVTVAATGALRCADRRLLTLAPVSLFFLPLVDAWPMAVLLVVWTIVCLPPTFRRDAVPGVVMLVGCGAAVTLWNDWKLPKSDSTDVASLLLLVPLLAGAYARRSSPWTRDAVWWTGTSTALVVASVWYEPFQVPALTLSVLLATSQLPQSERV